MKLNRPTLRRTAGAAVAAAALAGGLAVATVPAHAATPEFKETFKTCDNMSGGQAVDIWSLSTFEGKVAVGHCLTLIFTRTSLGSAVQLFLDNKGVIINQVIFVNNDPVTEDVTGSASDVHQGITIN